MRHRPHIATSTQIKYLPFLSKNTVERKLLKINKEAYVRPGLPDPGGLITSNVH